MASESPITMLNTARVISVLEHRGMGLEMKASLLSVSPST